MKDFYQNHLWKEDQAIRRFGEKGFEMSIDYTSYADENTNDNIVDETFTEITNDEVVDNETSEDATMMGVIANSKKVYLRKNSNKDSDPVTVMDAGDEVMIDGTSDDNSGNGWYHVITANSAEGYVMSDYVSLTE